MKYSLVPAQNSLDRSPLENAPKLAVDRSSYMMFLNIRLLWETRAHYSPKWETNSTSKKVDQTGLPDPILERIEMLEKTVLLKNKN